MSASRLAAWWLNAAWRVADPGASGTVSLANKGRAVLSITTAAAESRTIPAPEREGQELLVYLDTDGGNATCTITSGQGVSSVVLDDAGDCFCLNSIKVGGTAKWQLAWSEGLLSGGGEDFDTLLVVDDGVVQLGNDGDQALVNRSTSHTANTALTSVLVGTPAVAAIPANSLIVSNVTADGDQVFVTRPAAGADSIEWLRNDASAGITVFNEASGDIDLRIESNALSNFLVIDANSCLNGQLALGGAVPTNPQAFFAILPAVNATGVTANQSYFHATVLPGAAVTIPTGTAPVVASVNLHEPNITATGTVTEAATLRIVDAPTEGGLNAALWVDAGTTRLDGTTYIGDTVNANVTLGLTVNQAANDDQILALKSSDVGHAATGAGGAETDTYGAFLKAEAAAGGLLILGLKDGDGVSGHAVHIRGVLDETAADTTKTTAGIGVVTIDGTLEGTNVPAVLGSDENILVLRSLTTTRHIFDAEGTYHGDEAATTFDEHDDISLVRSFDVTSVKKKGVIKSQWDKFAIENEQKLIDLKILGAPRAEGGLVNFTRLIQLHNGAIWQMYEDMMEVAAALPDEIKSKIGGRVGKRLELTGTA